LKPENEKNNTASIYRRQAMSNAKQDGLKRLRNNGKPNTHETRDGKPDYYCQNCKCKRYNKCRCTARSL
jgi:hypothetical protein